MPEPTAAAYLRRRTVKLHTATAVTNLRIATRALRGDPSTVGSPLLHHLDTAQREAEKAARIADLWGAREPSLFDGAEG